MLEQDTYLTIFIVQVFRSFNDKLKTIWYFNRLYFTNY